MSGDISSLRRLWGLLDVPHGNFGSPQDFSSPPQGVASDVVMALNHSGGGRGGPIPQFVNELIFRLVQPA